MIRFNSIVAIFFVVSIFMNACNSAGNDGSNHRDSGNVKNQYTVTFVELGSVRCIPCKKMQPIMDEIEKEYKDQVKVVFHDVWTKEGKPFAEKYKIKLIPTQIFLDSEGKEYFRHQGFFPKKEILKILEMKGVDVSE